MREGDALPTPTAWSPSRRCGPGASESYNVVIDEQAIDKLNRLIERARSRCMSRASFRLDQAAEAHRALNEHYLGKLALRLS